MKLLLDTHAVLWWLDDPLLLSLTARQAIAEPGNDVLVSAAVCWEIAIKRGLGHIHEFAECPNSGYEDGLIWFDEIEIQTADTWEEEECEEDDE